MSLNDPNARYSVVGVTGPAMTGAYPAGVFGLSPWRQAIGWGYAGWKMFGIPPSSGSPGEQQARFRDRPMRRQPNETLGGFNDINAQ